MPLPLTQSGIIRITPEKLLREVMDIAAIHCEELLTRLPQLHERGLISTADYAESDRQLTALAGVFGDVLTFLGYPQPQPIR